MSQIIIDRIQLADTLPKVFENEPVPDSEVWRQSLTLERGRHYIVEAASGTGKSSLCAYIYGSRKDFLGEISFDGKSITRFGYKEWQEIRCRALAYLPQELALFPELTALQNIELKNRLTNHVGKERIEEWLHELGIDSRADFPVGKMSVGQQQRVAIIRSLCQPFSFILLDEPVSHLDEENNRVAARIIKDEAMRQNASIIATSVGNNLMIEADRTLRL